MDGPNLKERDYCKKGHDDDLIIRTLLSRELVNDTIIYVKDIDDDLFFRSLDCDLLLVNKSNNIKMAEVKADDYPPINNVKYIFLEYISNSNKYKSSRGHDGLGCILTSKCDYFIFYFIKLDKYLVVDSNKLKEFVKNNIMKYKTKEATTYSPNNKDVWYHSYGLLVPVDDIIAECAASLFDSKIKYDDIKNELFGNNNPDENWDWFDDYFITF